MSPSRCGGRWASSSRCLRRGAATAANLGDANVNGEVTPVRIKDKLPAGLRGVSIEGLAGTPQLKATLAPVECLEGSLTCTFAGTMPPYDQIEVLVGVVVERGASSSEVNEVSVSGGGTPSRSIRRPIMANGAAAPLASKTMNCRPKKRGACPIRRLDRIHSS